MITQATPTAVESLEPADVWRFFAGISAVPRPSKHEEQIRAHVRKTAEELGFKFREDRVGNIVIEVPATPGHENAPGIVLQGHVDMVCEKNAGTEHDFDRDPIQLIIDEDSETGEQIVRANGTTLGADNGIGLAMGLAAATSPNVVHGPIEILCTVDEEMGMTGAGQLEPGFVRGTRLLNLDSESDDVLYIGCAGGGDVTLTWEFDTPPIPGGSETCRVTVKRPARGPLWRRHSREPRQRHQGARAHLGARGTQGPANRDVLGRQQAQRAGPRSERRGWRAPRARWWP